MFSMLEREAREHRFLSLSLSHTHTHAHTHSGTAAKLNEFNFLSKQGSKALQAYQAFALGDDDEEEKEKDEHKTRIKRRLRKYREATKQSVEIVTKLHNVEQDMFITYSKELFEDIKTNKKKAPYTADVATFLNRLLGMKITSQNSILDLFENLLRNVISIDRQQGLYNDGIKRIDGKRMSLAKVAGNVAYIDPISKVPTTYVRLVVERGISWNEAKSIRDDKKNNDDKTSGFYCSKSKWFGRDHYLLALKSLSSSSDDTNLSYTVWRPTSGKGSIEIDSKSLEKRWKLIEDDSMAEKGWKQAVLDAQERCLHGKKCKFGSSCDAGKPQRNVHVLCGVVIPILGLVENTIKSFSSSRRLSVVQATINVDNDDKHNDSTTTKRVVGLRIPSQCSDQILRALQKVSGQKKLRSELGLDNIVEKKKKQEEKKTKKENNKNVDDVIDLCSPPRKKRKNEIKRKIVVPEVVDLSKEEEEKKRLDLTSPLKVIPRTKETKNEEEVIDLCNDNDDSNVKVVRQLRLVSICNQFYFSEIKMRFPKNAQQKQQKTVRAEIQYTCNDGTTRKNNIMMSLENGVLYSFSGSLISSIQYVNYVLNSMNHPTKCKTYGENYVKKMLCTREVFLGKSFKLCVVLVHDFQMYHKGDIRVILHLQDDNIFYGMKDKKCYMTCDGQIKVDHTPIASRPSGVSRTSSQPIDSWYSLQLLPHLSNRSSKQVHKYFISPVKSIKRVFEKILKQVRTLSMFSLLCSFSDAPTKTHTHTDFL